MKSRLTKAVVQGAAPGKKPYLIMDTEVPGFGLRVECSGKKTYLVRYRLNGKRTQVRIGDSSVLTPALARDEAKKMLVRIGTGEDPHHKPPAEELTVDGLCQRYKAVCDEYYRDSAGGPTSTMHSIRRALRTAQEKYKALPAAEFSPRNLTDIREGWIEEGLTRKTINAYMAVLKNMFRWAAEQEIVPANVHHSLQTVSNLRKNRSEAKESDPVKPVPSAHVKAARQYLSKPVAALIDLLSLTGARPSELTGLRVCDIDTSGELWSLRPGQHKTSYMERDRVILFGPQAQEILRPFMQRAPEAYLFSPREAETERYQGATIHRRPNQKPTPRKTNRTLGQHYTAGSLRKAVQRACEKAGVPVWTPYQLRHSVATAIRKRYGLEAAQVLLGHSKADVTQIYAERDFEMVKRIMEKEG